MLKISLYRDRLCLSVSDGDITALDFLKNVFLITHKMMITHKIIYKACVVTKSIGP